ncbi:ribosomal lysine N-methyltransferase 3-like [Neltuma alba]|uniref:ribosomal lysine N-methyltransferase 3-like n=1 Tax=Neltuma alba TaxID=207710 RepID=UPI0010A4DA0E|nr:ribosomal lysine N-methyltransferase 3-like [Prosopis alba]
MANSRRLRAFKRWMASRGFEISDGLEFVDDPGNGIAVRALCQLKEGDVVARIPKDACLTIKTSGASQMIEDYGLAGNLGLAVALMYERSLGEKSPWAGYLQVLPHQECLPLVWTLNEVNELLSGTELHKTVQEDKALMYEDWKENILPVLDFSPSKLNLKYFGVEEYFAARSLIASRAFEIDDYHGFGMVPLADLFNHKTDAEDVHFTAVSSNYDNDDDGNECVTDEEELAENSSMDGTELDTALIGKYSDGNLESSSVVGDDSSMLEMIMIKDVSVGAEVFNTYGSMGNAALLHRYGFTEQDNSYDIVNIDLELVLQWCSSLFSSRYSRARVSLWRRLGYSACVSQNLEYFEISSDGEPQIELLILLYIMLLSEDAYHKLDLSVSVVGNVHESSETYLSGDCNILTKKASDMSKESLLTRKVCDALFSVADMRESLYGNSIEDDIETLGRCNCVRERKLFHSLVLRISERKILEKLRNYAAQPIRIGKRNSARKKMKSRKK